MSDKLIDTLNNNFNTIVDELVEVVGDLQEIANLQEIGPCQARLHKLADLILMYQNQINISAKENKINVPDYAIETAKLNDTLNMYIDVSELITDLKAEFIRV